MTTSVQNDLEAYIEKLGISVYQCAQDLGLSPGGLYRYVNQPDLLLTKDMKEKFINFYHCEVSDLEKTIDSSDAATK